MDGAIPPKGPHFTTLEAPYGPPSRAHSSSALQPGEDLLQRQVVRYTRGQLSCPSNLAPMVRLDPRSSSTWKHASPWKQLHRPLQKMGVGPGAPTSKDPGCRAQPESCLAPSHPQFPPQHSGGPTTPPSPPRLLKSPSDSAGAWCLARSWVWYRATWSAG